MIKRIPSMQECEGRTRKARFWGRLSHMAMMAFGVLVGLLVLALIIMGALSAFGKSVSAGLFDNIIFALVGLLILTSLAVLISNFLKSLYHGTPGCACGSPDMNCSLCGFQESACSGDQKDE